MNYKVKDSGIRQAFNTGAVRDMQEGKGRFDLITPVAEERLAKHYEAGAEKYGDSNWAKGIPIKRLIDSAKRHLNKYLKGMRDEDHIIACVWNCFAIAHTEEMILNGMLDGYLLDGLPCYIAEKDMDANTKDWWDRMTKLLQEARDVKEANKVKEEKLATVATEATEALAVVAAVDTSAIS